MTILAWVLGILAGLCAIMGVVVALDVLPMLAEVLPGFSALLWVALGSFLMLGCIASVLSKSEYE